MGGILSNLRAGLNLEIEQDIEKATQSIQKLLVEARLDQLRKDMKWAKKQFNLNVNVDAFMDEEITQLNTSTDKGAK